MKVSRSWLQNYFVSPLPAADEIAEALTFHAFEIESTTNVRHTMSNMGDWVLDVKVTPNRGHDCLSHRGIAGELSAILELPLNKENDPFAKAPDFSKKTEIVSVFIENPELCSRYIAGHINGVKVGPSPEWLKKSLEAIGQRSINNIVDATNLVMLNTGQPLHAFDAEKLGARGEGQGKNMYSIQIRKAKLGERMMALDDKEYVLSESMLVIADGNAGVPIGIAGVKGGKASGVDEKTKDLILESANFDGVSVRRTAAALKLRTDASDRFQQVISPELAAYGMQQAVDLILAIAGGSVEGFVDEYPKPQRLTSVSVSLKKINAILGTKLSAEEVADVWKRMRMAYRIGENFVVEIPFERLDLTIAEDLIEEIGRIRGYDEVAAAALPPFPKKPEINTRFYAAEKAREDLMAKGYSEVFKSVFVEEGERAVANKIGGEKPFLRATLVDGLKEAQERNERNKDLLGLQEVRLFEIGTVWKGGKEIVMLGLVDKEGVREEPLKIQEASPLGYDDLPISTLDHYTPFSKYPFIVRDIAMWMPEDPDGVSKALAIFASEAGMLLRHVHLFDQFKRGGRVSYAFRLVLQSFEKTLTDEEANAVMERVYTTVKGRGWEVR